jgi:hypothetical protein
MSDKKHTSDGLGIGMVLFLIFMTLKLTNYINWSWWWVTAPLWIPLAAVIAIGGIAVIVAYIMYKIK